MLSHERQDALQTMLQEHGSIVISEVAKNWDVSEMTVRRDVQSLERKGVLIRVHGGAVPSDTLRWKNRARLHTQKKQNAAHKLISMIPEKGCIYLDGSTTIFNCCDALAGRNGLTVVTNNLDTFHRLQQQSGISVQLIGGTYQAETDSFIGALARQSVCSLAFDLALFSAYGIDPALGCCEPRLDDAELKTLVAERTHRVGVALDSSKLGRFANGVWVSEAQKSVLATDLDPQDKQLDLYRSRFAELL